MPLFTAAAAINVSSSSRLVRMIRWILYREESRPPLLRPLSRSSYRRLDAADAPYDDDDATMANAVMENDKLIMVLLRFILIH